MAAVLALADTIDAREAGWVAFAVASMLVYPVTHCVIQCRRRRRAAAKTADDVA